MHLATQTLHLNIFSNKIQQYQLSHLLCLSLLPILLVTSSTVDTDIRPTNHQPSDGFNTKQTPSSEFGGGGGDDDVKIQAALNIVRNRNTGSLPAIDFLFAHQTDRNLDPTNQIDANLSRLLGVSGPDKRAARGYIEVPGISLEVSKRAWSLLHLHTSVALRNRIDLVLKPALQNLFSIREANQVSRQCQKAIWTTLERAKLMDSWAVKLLLSWASIPTKGLFDGTYSEPGAYRTCLQIPKNHFIDHAHYCSITYGPVLPQTEPFRLIFRKEAQELLRMFDRHPDGDQSKRDDPVDRDFFADLIAEAHYFHLLYLKFGSCWPIACSPYDVQVLVKIVGRQNMLMHGPIRCNSLYSDDYEYSNETGTIQAGLFDDVRALNQSTTDELRPKLDYNSSQLSDESIVIVKKRKTLAISMRDLNDGIFVWKPHIKASQKVALVILGLLILFILSMTLIDFILIRLPKFYTHFKELIINTHEHSPMVLSDSKAMNELVTSNHDDNNGLGLAQNTEQSAAAASLNPHQIATRPLNDIPTAIPNEQVAVYSSTELEAHKSLVTNSGQKTIFNSTRLDDLRRNDRNRGSNFMQIVSDCSLLNSLEHFLYISQRQLESDIRCLNGLRCIFMSWIILVHTMLYNDWSMFGQTRMVEKSTTSLLNQPIFNASYLVDVFFLMSGILTAFTSFRHCQGSKSNFNPIGLIILRWLRLTPQMFIISLIYMIFPLLSDKLNWFGITGEWAENCQDNWWINLFQLQAFVSSERMCIFVTWWISIDFIYHFIAAGIICIFLLRGHSSGFLSTICVIIPPLIYQAVRHYRARFPPNALSTIPVAGPMWADMTMGFIWQPYSHSVPFFFGFYLGYLMAMKTKLITRALNSRRAAVCWLLTGLALIVQGYSTYWWVIGEADYSPFMSTIFHIIAPIIWTLAFCWLTIACHYGYGGFINTFLSMKLFMIFGKASYMVYLAHFQVLFTIFGNQTLLIEPSETMIFYMMIGNIIASTLYGSLLCITFEIPWLKIYNRLLKCM